MVSRVSETIIDRAKENETVQAVRQRIIEILKEQGSGTVAELADTLGMAQVSVRHHLDILVGEDLVIKGRVRRRQSAGRPSQVYTLTTQALKLFPQRHDILASNLLTEMKAALPGQEVRELLARVAARTAQEAPATSADQHIEERLTAIAGFLTEKGYNARWETKNGHYEIYACNCPYAGVADRHPELCWMDQAMIQHLLPDAVRLQTQALDGAHHCTYVISVTPEPA